MMDGVYEQDAQGGLRFSRSEPPSELEMIRLAGELRRRVHTLFKRRGLLATRDDDNSPVQLDALASCMNTALTVGQRARSGPALAVVEEEDVERPRGGLVARVDGLNLYASDAIPAGDRELLEKLCRYLLRGPLTLGRLQQRDDGMLTYRMKKADRRGNTVLVLTPMQLMMRLCSLIPAPRHPTRRCFGIIAPGAKDRKRVVPRPTARKKARCSDDDKPRPPVQSPVKWSELLRRVWGLDALGCARCGASMTPIAVIEDDEQIARFLAHTGKATVHERARGPPHEDAA